jgi:hypothetical protein
VAVVADPLEEVDVPRVRDVGMRALGAVLDANSQRATRGSSTYTGSRSAMTARVPTPGGGETS